MWSWRFIVTNLHGNKVANILILNVLLYYIATQVMRKEDLPLCL